MPQLSTHLRRFLLRNQDQLSNRKFVINTMTRTDNRPILICHPTLIHEATSEDRVSISLVNSLSSPIYPDFKSSISNDQVDRLDAIDKWMYDNNLPLVKDTPDIIFFIREIQNYFSLSDAEKEKVNQAGDSLRGISESDYINYLIKERFSNLDTVEIIHLVDDKSEKAYIAELHVTTANLLENKIELCILSDNITERLMTEVDTLDIGPGDVVNVKEHMTTTVGRMLINQVFCVRAFGDLLPFYNKTININDGDILDDVSKLMMAKKATVEQYKKFMDGVYYIGHFTEICTPCINERALMTDPNVAKRKAELYKQYAGQLDDPIIISKIEDELIAMDKAWLKGDTSMRFYKPLGGKSFDLWRKKLYIAVGGIEAFDKDTSKYDFIPNSLEEGMTLKDLPKYGNESRKGSYQRGHETRNGGALTKYIIRAFHDSRIQEEDCGTHKGVMINFGEYAPKQYKGRFILMNGKWTEITDDLIPSIKPIPYLMRSPQYCQCTKNGYCFKCMGRMFSDMDIRQLTMNVVDISTTFMNAAMKNMHGSKLALHEINSLDSFIL